MRLPVPTLSVAEQLEEFDHWVTAYLSTIQDSQKFRDELKSADGIFGLLAQATRDFESIDSCKPIEIAKVVGASIRRAPTSKKEEFRTATHRFLVELVSVLFLVTARTDNNVKCQLPLYLRETLGWQTIPARRGRGASRFADIPIPRVFNSADFMTRVTEIFEHEVYERSDLPITAEALLATFLSFVLGDHASVSQFWSIGRAYCALARDGQEARQALLTPLVTFKVRGSVSASGGHEPEQLLRSRLEEWGLLRDVDFNSTDVVVSNGALVASPEGASGRGVDDSEGGAAVEATKTRAYDFVLPFQTPGWEQGLFIQSQFYAGDSGSVSHKNVDQTESSRRKVLGLRANARFIEYVDGAGYYASLNGDLKRLLSMQTTRSFFQVRSIPIRLRRELQAIGFLTPLEIEQAILRTNGSVDQVDKLLRNEGYSPEEIGRCLGVCVDRGMVEKSGERLVILGTRLPLVRCYLALDVVAASGASLPAGAAVGVVTIPGAGAAFGLALDELTRHVQNLAPDVWRAATELSADVVWLCKQGFAKLK